MIGQTGGYGLEGLDGDYGNLVHWMYGELTAMLDGMLGEGVTVGVTVGVTEGEQEGVSINEVFIYLRTIISSNQVPVH